jgi:ribonucrease Y
MIVVVYILMGAVLVGIVGGVLVGRMLAQRTSSAAAALAEDQAKKLLDSAKIEAESLKKDAEVHGKELAFKVKAEVEEDIRQRKADVARREAAAAARDDQLEKRSREAQRRDDDLGRREKQLGSREQSAEAAAKQSEAALAAANAKLEKIGGMTAAEARQVLVDQMQDEARKQAAGEIKRIEAAAREEATEKAQRVLATAIQRYASEYVTERTVSVVPLPSDDMKGRLIGREGRNVRALEAATGTDLIIDDTPECITISCFNPVRREIARLAIGKLVADGRIHPTRIEEVVQKCEKEVEGVCKEAGEQAVFDLGLHRVHPDLVRLLGGLKFRASYAQNLLAHSVEVGYLAGLMAGELGLNVKTARRAGLLHDIGKAVDHEHEGPHALVGAALAKKYGESPKVCQAIAAHHEDVAHESVLDHIVDAANLLSGQRPGARRETLESYVQRLTNLEKLAKSFQGVEKAFALQMGREVRVIVENSAISDEQAVLLSRDLAKRIEAEASYPGQVRVCVIRETRASDYAK